MYLHTSAALLTLGDSSTQKVVKTPIYHHSSILSSSFSEVYI